MEWCPYYILFPEKPNLKVKLLRFDILVRFLKGQICNRKNKKDKRKLTP